MSAHTVMSSQPDKKEHGSNNIQNPDNKLTTFFLIISLFIIAISILAVFSTIAAAEYGIKKDDLQTASLMHLVKHLDWWNDYEEQRLGEKLLQTEIDDLNLTLHTNNPSVSLSGQSVYYNQTLRKHQSYIDALHANKSVDGSLANLKYNAETELKAYDKSLVTITESSEFITIYEFITILLIIGAGLGGISEIAKNKLLGYPSFIVGGAGIILLLLTLFGPSTVAALFH
jgi:hypothetical protein